MKKLKLLLLFVVSLSVNLRAQAPVKEIPLTRILFIFDCSLSMSGKWQTSSKMDVSKKILMKTIDTLSKTKNLEIALRMYGHQSSLFPERDCKDTKLEVPFSKNNFAAIKNRIKNASPKGTTPIAYTLEQCGADFPDNKARNIVFLITDGVEECDGDPCAISAALQKKGVVLQPFVLGVGIDENFKKTFECMGKYFDAANEKMFESAMGIIISQALNSTTAQVNLLDAYGKPTETNVNMSFYDMRAEQLKYNFIHTLNHKGNPDTIPLDPLPTYKMVVHTIPPIVKDSIDLTPGKHNIIAVDAPQGYLNLKVTSMNLNDQANLKYIIRKNKEMQTLNVQSADKTEKYLTGKYDIEILTMPRLVVPDVIISQSKTTSVQIPQLGLANIVMSTVGYGSLYLVEKNELKWVYNFSDNSTKETLNLLPGKYRAVFRSKSSKESIYTYDREFKVEPGGSVTVKLF
ncbi:MAG: hypothetical protein V4667_08665 [Bacteroidota bacterium]